MLTLMNESGLTIMVQAGRASCPLEEAYQSLLSNDKFESYTFGKGTNHGQY
jgi:hypothetical protein